MKLMPGSSPTGKRYGRRLSTADAQSGHPALEIEPFERMRQRDVAPLCASKERKTVLAVILSRYGIFYRADS